MGDIHGLCRIDQKELSTLPVLVGLIFMFVVNSSSEDRRRAIHNVRHLPTEHHGGVNVLCNQRTASVLQMEQRRRTFNWIQRENIQ